MPALFLIKSRHRTTFHFRRRVPLDLVPQLGKTHITCSLQTDSLQLAQVRARAAAATTDAAFEHIRTMSDSNPIDNDKLIKAVLRRKVQIKQLEINDAHRALEDTRELQEARLRRQAQAHEEAIEALKKAHALELQNVKQRAAITILKDREDVHERQQQEQHDRNQELAVRAEAAAAQGARSAAPTITANELLEDFLREGVGSGRWKNPETAKTRDYAPIWKRFAAHADKHGLTAAATKAYRAEVMAREQDSPETKKRNLYRVRAVIAHGIDHHDLDAKMLAHLKTARGTRSGGGKVKSYLPFTDDELILLFHSRPYLDNTFKKASQFWLPLLGLYTGARLEELAGLHLASFSTVDGAPSMRLSDHETTDEGKNEHAPRELPIHPELIKAGLLTYVELLRTEGHERLFPEIGASARDGFAKRATTDFTDYRRSVGVGKDEGERSRKVFHSFRSTLAGKLFPLTGDADLRRRLLGHAAKDVHEGTYLGAISIPMERATEVMSRVSFGLQHPEFQDTAAYKKARNRKPRS